MTALPFAARFVVLSGLPARGKSTVARPLAAALGLPLIDKDELLEALFDSQGTGDATWRRALSETADEAFQRRAEASDGAVLVSWWRHPLSSTASGTPTDWLARLPGIVVEIHCRCSPATAARRFMARQRHSGHLDNRWQRAELAASFEVQATLGALGVGRCISIDTEAARSNDAVAQCAMEVHAAIQGCASVHTLTPALSRAAGEGAMQSFMPLTKPGNRT